MISSWDPESFFALHTCIANHDVFDRDHESGSHVKYSSYVWRGEDYRKRLCMSGREIVRIKIASFFPLFIYTILGSDGIVGFEEFLIHGFKYSRKKKNLPRIHGAGVGLPHTRFRGRPTQILYHACLTKSSEYARVKGRLRRHFMVFRSKIPNCTSHLFP